MHGNLSYLNSTAGFVAQQSFEYLKYKLELTEDTKTPFFEMFIVDLIFQAKVVKSFKDRDKSYLKC
jgi:hypothetical protein